MTNKASEVSIKEIKEALKRVYLSHRGQSFIAADLAQELYPDQLRGNSEGAVFNQAAGTAGRLLRRSKLVHEVENGRWEVVPEWLFEIPHNDFCRCVNEECPIRYKCVRAVMRYTSRGAFPRLRVADFEHKNGECESFVTLEI